MTISISFYNDIKYNKDDFMGRDKDFFGNGLVNLTDFPITYPSPANMTLQLGAGTAWIDGYRIHNDSLVTLTVTAADATNPRIDIIQIGHDDINSTFSLQVKAGVPAASPVEPGADPNYIKLYAINVVANVTSITSANVTDRRALVPLNVSGTQINYSGAVSKSGDTMTGELDGPAFKATDAFIGPNLITGFKNLLDPSKQSFTRASNATRKDLTPVPFNVLRTEQGRFGQGAFIEEAATEIVLNNDFETITGTATVFSDAMTAGTTADPAWTTTVGSFTWSTSGATSGVTGATITAGNTAWKPLTGTNGAVLSLTAQATFTEPATIGNFAVLLQTDASNYYVADYYSGAFHIEKKVAGTGTTITTVTQALSASHPYTITFSITPSGQLTAKLYDGAGIGGTLLQTLTTTDTSLTGGFLVGVSGDTGVVIKSASVTAPFADGWTISGDSRVAWALTSTNPISGSYSVSAVGVAGVSGWVNSTSVAGSPSTTYTASGYISGTSVGTGGAKIILDWYQGTTYLNQVSTSLLTGTFATQRSVISGTSTASTDHLICALSMSDTGTAVFDAIQIEQKAYVTSFVSNPSTSSSMTRQADSLSYTLSSPLPSRYFGALVWTPQYASSVTPASGTNSRTLYWALNQNGTKWRYGLHYSTSLGVIRFSKYDGTTAYNCDSSAITYNVNDRIFIAWMDDPTTGYMYLWIGVNGGTLNSYTTANTVQITDAQQTYIGCRESNNSSGSGGVGYEANGTIDYPIITDIIPTADQVQALYQASDWGGVRHWPMMLNADQQAWIAPTLLNGWVNYGGGTSPVGYFKDSLGIVHLRGLIKSGTVTVGTTLLQLPVGYRPYAQLNCVVANNGAYSQVVVNVDGTVNLTGSSASNVWLSIDNITFRAEQ